MTRRTRRGGTRPLRVAAYLVGALVACCHWAAPAQAHEFRPGHVWVRAHALGEWRIDVQSPRYRRGGRLMAQPELRVHDSACRLEADANLRSRYWLRCPLDGATAAPDSVRVDGRLEIGGLAREGAEMIVHSPRTVSHADEAFADAASTSLLDARRASLSLASLVSAARRGEVDRGWRHWARKGVAHVAGGWDHLAFLLMWVLVAMPAGARGRSSGRTLLLGVSVFTLAHAAAMLATLCGVRLAAAPVEVCIASSIVVLAGQLLRASTPAARDLAPRRSANFVFMTAAFGGLHGLGFASALMPLREPATEVSSIVVPVVAFNLGVEASQLGFVAVAAGLVAFADRSRWGPHLRLLAPYLVGTVASAWALDRIARMVAG